MIAFIITIIKIIILLGFLIMIHELGHFIVAKLCKVKVNEFSIGFGPGIWNRQGKETKYSLRAIPLGGYVSMEGEDGASEDKNAFSKASIPKRIAICMAGAIVNILFAIIVYFILMAVSGVYISNEVDTTISGGSAEQAGIQSGDKIIEINEQNVNNKTDLDKIMQKQDGKELKVVVDREGEEIPIYITPMEVKTKSTGMYLDENCKVMMVEKGSSSERQGIQANDVIVKINNEETNGNTNKIIEILQEEGTGTILLTIKRANAELNVEFVPDYISTYYLGVNMKMAPDTFGNRCIYGFMQTKEFLFSIVDNMKQLFTGNIGIDQMTGPVGIGEMVSKTNSIRDFIYLMALISISLGVTNLLPIPALDGGKILILIIEAIRRKPMKPENEINIQLLGFSILIALSIYVTYNDILRLF